MDFTSSMKLEMERLRINLSAAERDRALLSVGTDPATINPNSLLDERYMCRLLKLANYLSVLGHSALEDRVIGLIGLESTDENIIDFWNIPAIGESCSNSKCEIHFDRESGLQGLSAPKAKSNHPLLLVCSSCRKKVCEICCAGWGATLLIVNNLRDTGNFNGSPNQGGSSHGDQRSRPSFGRSDAIICLSCCDKDVQDSLIVDYVRLLTSLRRKSRANEAAIKALDQVITTSYKDIVMPDFDLARTVLQKLLDGEESLAEFPDASLLHTVILFIIVIYVNVQKYFQL